MDQYVVEMKKIDPVVVEQIKSKNRIDYVRVFLVTVNWLIVIAVVGVVYWLFFDDNPPAEIKQISARETVVNAGDQIVIDLIICKYTDAPAAVHVNWINDIMFTQPPSFPVLNQTGCSDQSVLLVVPHTLPAAVYTVRGDAHYNVNPLAERSIAFEFGPITIEPENEP